MMKLPLDIEFPYRGILALAGSGEYLPPMEPVDTYLMSRLPEPARVVCLPTAAGTEGEDRLQYWKNLGENHFHKLGASSVESLPVFTRDDAENPTLIEKVRNANFIYISGGKPSYLLDCLSGTALLKTILENLALGGIVAGCSAGAMIFGERVPNRFFTGGTLPALCILPDTFIVPHFDEIPFMLRFAATHMVGDLQLIGVEANTILCCAAKGFSIVGSGGVTLSQGKENIRYTT